MIDYKRKFIFVHVYKVAGTSITTGLQNVSPIEKFKRKILSKIGANPEDDQPHAHATATDYIDKLGYKKFKDFFSFGFVRNPFDWQVSLYEYARQTPVHYQYEIHQKMNFEQYVDWRCDNKHLLQKDFLYHNGEVAVDFIGKFENIREDVSTVSERLGLNLSLPHTNKSRRSDYQSYYDERTKRRIQETFRADFEAFGYALELD